MTHEPYQPSRAARRMLGSRPRLRQLSAIAWSSFLGAACTMAALLLAPLGIMLPPNSLGEVTVIFLALWLLAMIPAGFASVLAAEASSTDENGD